MRGSHQGPTIKPLQRSLALEALRCHKRLSVARRVAFGPDHEIGQRLAGNADNSDKTSTSAHNNSDGRELIRPLGRISGDKTTSRCNLTDTSLPATRTSRTDQLLRPACELTPHRSAIPEYKTTSQKIGTRCFINTSRCFKEPVKIRSCFYIGPSWGESFPDVATRRRSSSKKFSKKIT